MLYILVSASYIMLVSAWQALNRILACNPITLIDSLRAACKQQRLALAGSHRDMLQYSSPGTVNVHELCAIN